MSLRFEVLEGRDALLDALPEWDEFVAAAEDPGGPLYFLESAWLGPWIRHKVTDQPVFLALMRDESGIQAGIPLQIIRGKRGGLRGRRFAAIGFPESDSVDLLGRSGAARMKLADELIRWWQKNFRQVHALDLRELTEGGKGAAALTTAAEARGLPVEVHRVSQSPIYETKAWIESGRKLGGNLGRNIRRKRRKLEAAGEIESFFRRVPVADYADELARCTAIENASWKGQEGLGFLRSANQPFMDEVWRLAAEQGRLLVGYLTLNGEPITYHWGTDDRGSFLSVNLAYVDAVKHLSAGKLLLQDMVEMLEDNDLQALDASRGGLDHPHPLISYHGPIRFHTRVTVFGKGLRARGERWAFLRGQKNLAEARVEEAED